jgi:hypothetical protein
MTVMRFVAPKEDYMESGIIVSTPYSPKAHSHPPQGVFTTVFDLTSVLCNDLHTNKGRAL